MTAPLVDKHALRDPAVAACVAVLVLLAVAASPLEAAWRAWRWAAGRA
jgi:hypothetical protein